MIETEIGYEKESYWKRYKLDGMVVGNMLWFMIAFILGICILIFILSWRVSSHVILPSYRTNEMLLQREIARKKYDAAFYEGLEKREFDIQTKDGIRLHCMELNDEHTKQQTQAKIAVLCHGFRCAMVCSVIYAKVFLHLGYRVILFDQRNHGESERTYSGMGYYEANDLNEVIHWCRQAYGRDIHIVTHGDSMGGSTVLLQLALDEKVDAVISDCPFSSLDELLVHQVKTRFHLPRWIVPIADICNVVRAGFHFYEVSPINVVREKQTPILYIHGMEDHYVPTDMSRKLHAVTKHSELYLVPDAKHSASCVTNLPEYENQIRTFLEQYGIESL